MYPMYRVRQRRLVINLVYLPFIQIDTNPPISSVFGDPLDYIPEGNTIIYHNNIRRLNVIVDLDTGFMFHSDAISESVTDPQAMIESMATL
jgi:hypothetical protein